MIVVDSSAWIEYFRDGQPLIVNKVDRCLEQDYRLLRSRGLTVRKTIDVLIGTFCAENDMQLVHYDRDFDAMAPHIGLRIV